MKRFLVFLLATFLMVSALGCTIPANTNLVQVPDVKDSAQSVAETALAALGLIPTAEYEYNDSVKKGCVIRTLPLIGETVEKGTRITLYISKGPSEIFADDSVITWWNIGSEEDEWEFYKPYILDNNLYIEVQPTFAESFKLENFGTATINDSFDKKLPVSLEFENGTDLLSVSKGKEVSFVIKVPIQDLDIQQTTNLAIQLIYYYSDPHEQEKIDLEFTISW